MCRSSISNSDRVLSSRRIDRDAAIAVGVCILILLTAEILARRAFAPLGDRWSYWDPRAARIFDWYTRQSRSESFPLVFSGDSTAARNFLSPDVGVQLSWPANYPLAWERVALPLLDRPHFPPETLVLSFSPLAFFDLPEVVRSEASILGSPLARKNAGQWHPGDWIALARFRGAFAYRHVWWTGPAAAEAPADAGALPLEPRPGWEEQPETRPELPDLPLNPRRLAVLERAAELCRLRGIRLILVLPPRLNPPEDWLRLESRYRIALQQFCARQGVEWIDGRRLIPADASWFYDRYHLNRPGALRFTHDLRQIIFPTAVPP